jgi:hypothetical protein
MHALILDFKTDALDPNTSNLLGFSATTINIATNEVISAIAHLIKPQHKIISTLYIPASEETLTQGLSIIEAQKILSKMVGDKKITVLVVANATFDLSILLNKIGINSFGKQIIDLCEDTPDGAVSQALDAVDKNTSINLIEHQQSMLNKVLKHTVTVLLTTKEQVKRLVKVVKTKKCTTDDLSYLTTMGFSYNSYFKAWTCFLRPAALGKLIAVLTANANWECTEQGALDILQQLKAQLENTNE